MNTNHFYFDSIYRPDENLENQFFNNPSFETQLFNDTNFIFSRNSRRVLDDHVTQLNNNVVVLGTSGSGKTTGFVDPNIRQAVGSMVVSDPKGILVKKHGRFLEEEGYRVRVMDFIHPERSVRWNPLAQAKTTQDILRISNSLTYDYGRCCTASIRSGIRTPLCC